MPEFTFPARFEYLDEIRDAVAEVVPVEGALAVEAHEERGLEVLVGLDHRPFALGFRALGRVCAACFDTDARTGGSVASL